MTRRLATIVLLLGLALALAACGSSKKSSGKSSSSDKKVAAATISVWTPFVNPELKTLKAVIADFMRKYPQIKVKVVGGTNDDKIVAAIRGGNAPDVAQSFSSDNTGAFCPSGAWIDLGPYMKKDGISDSIFPKAPREYTKFQGKRCALPMLADTYGLYYNKTLLAKAGYKSPPKTISQLTTMAKKLTQRDASGKLKVVGFNPFPSWYENVPAHFAPSWGATWMNGDKSALDTPEWQALLKWQKSLIDYYGWSNLVRFNAGAGDEFSASNAFETGKVAMHMDGEWRVAFIKREHPELKYGTAPFPVADDKQDLYGAGYTTGSIIGIPRTSKHKDQAWLLVKYLGTNSNALAKLSNGIQNVPTTTDSLHSPLLRPLPGFQTFLDVFGNKHTLTTPITRIGSANQETFQSFVTKYLSGSSKNLSGGLKKVDLQIDALLQQQQAGSAP